MPTLVCFISPINIMHEHTKTDSKYTGKTGAHSIWEQMYIILLKLKIMPREARLKKILNLKK